ncbi:MAG: S8 family serine peptidase, partial [Candidatus Thorarchaeota archaeon]
DRNIPIDYASTAREIIGDFSVEDEVSFSKSSLFKIFKAQLKPRQILSLTSLPWVLQIEENHIDIELFMDSARGANGANVDAMRELYPELDGNMDGDINTYSKDDIVIAIIDTGIDGNHYDLDGGKIIGWYDSVANTIWPNDPDGHGTACAGIAAGTGDANWDYRGVAPYAALVGVKAIGHIYPLVWDVLEGLEWIVLFKEIYGINIVSISWGYYYDIWQIGAWPFYSMIEILVNSLILYDLTAVVAAGNYIEGYSLSRYVAIPGTAQTAITVGASYDGWSRVPTSAWGNSTEHIKPDVLAPGNQIHAPLAGTYDQYWTDFGGTSAAAPFIAGLAGLFLEGTYLRHLEGDYQSRLKHLLMASAEDPFDPYDDPPGKDTKNGAGFVDAMNVFTFWHDDISSQYSDARETLFKSTSKQEWWNPTPEPLWIADQANGEDWYKLTCLERIMITVDVWGDPKVVIKIWIIDNALGVLTWSMHYINNHAYAGHVTNYEGLYYVKISVLDYSGDYYDIRIHTIPS